MCRTVQKRDLFGQGWLEFCWFNFLQAVRIYGYGVTEVFKSIVSLNQIKIRKMMMTSFFTLSAAWNYFFK